MDDKYEQNDFDENQIASNGENSTEQPEEGTSQSGEYSYTGDELTSDDTDEAENKYEQVPQSNAGGTRYYDSNPDSAGAIPPKKKGRAGLVIAITAILLAVILATVGICAAIFGSGKAPVNGQPSDTDGGKSVEVVTGDAGGNQSGDNVQLGYSDSGNSYSITQIVKNVADAVVEIRTEKLVTGSWIGQYVSEGAGSGVIVSTDGFIVTNNHVIEGAEKITVYLRDGKEYSATLWGTNAKNDLAVIKIEATGLKTASFGNSDALEVGELAVVIGNPLGSLGGTVTSGIISALARQIQVDGKSMTLIQTDAPVNPGNSGGGMFNEAGELVGIINAKSSGDNIEGIGFAIPSSAALPIIQDIIQNKTSTQKAYLGVTVNYSSRYGVVYLATVEKDSDAERAGLQKDDIIISFNGTQVTSASQLTSLVSSCYVGDKAELVIYRDSKSMVLEVEFTQVKPENS